MSFINDNNPLAINHRNWNCLMVSGSAGSSGTVVLLTFEGVLEYSQVANFYATDPNNYGITFDSIALVAYSTDNPPVNLPSPISYMYLSGVSGTPKSTIMNCASGFTAISFYYSSIVVVPVTIYDGINGTGSVLFTTGASPYAANNAGLYDVWTKATPSFSGTAKSVKFQGNAAQTLFDNISVTKV